ATSPIACPSATAIESEKNGMPRLALIEPSIGSTTTTSVDVSARGGRMPSSSDTSVKSAPVESSQATTTCSAAASIAVVSSPPSPTPSTCSRSARVGSSSSTPRTSATAARQVASQSVRSRSQREEQQSGRKLGVEVGALLRQRLAALDDVAHLLDRGRAQQQSSAGLAAVDPRHGLVRPRRVAHGAPD